MNPTQSRIFMNLTRSLFAYYALAFAISDLEETQEVDECSSFVSKLVCLSYILTTNYTPKIVIIYNNKFYWIL